MSLAGRGIVVTGGSGALGREVVRALLAAGARVAVPYLGAGAWGELRASVREDAPLWGAGADLGDIGSARGFFEKAAGWLGRLDGVAACAGGWAGSATLEAAPEDQWEQMLRVNLHTAHATCRAALPHLLRHGGSVVTVGSAAVEGGGAGAAAYAVSKAGVHALTRALALENRDRGVRFNAVIPGTIDTPANRRAMPHGDPSRWTPPAQIAQVILFLLGPESAPVTGGLVPAHGRA